MTEGSNIVNKIKDKAKIFEQNSKNASDAMRIISSALLFPILALAYKGQGFAFILGSRLFYSFMFFCLYFLADLFQYLFVVLAIQIKKDEKKLFVNIQYTLFYSKFCFGILGLIYLILNISIK